MASIVLDKLSNLQPCNEHIKTVSQIARCKVWPPELIIVVQFFFFNLCCSDKEYMVITIWICCFVLYFPSRSTSQRQWIPQAECRCCACPSQEVSHFYGWLELFLPLLFTWFDEMVQMVETVEYFFLLYFSCFAQKRLVMGSISYLPISNWLRQ